VVIDGNEGQLIRFEPPKFGSGLALGSAGDHPVPGLLLRHHERQIPPYDRI